MATTTLGLYRKPNGKGGYFPTWLVRLDVPADVRGRIRAGGTPFGRVLKASTEETDERVARRVAERLQAQWRAEFAEARALGSGPLATVEAAHAAIENWRRVECDAAAGIMTPAPVRPLPPEVSAFVESLGVTLLAPGAVDIAEPGQMRPVRQDAAKWARAYFASHPEASNKPWEVGLLIGRLQVAVREASGWTNVAGFDDALEAAVVSGGAVGSLTAAAREKVRPHFAAAYLEVEQHREHQRQRAASILAAVEAASSSPHSVKVTAAPGVYVPREGDLTVGELIAKVTAAKIAEQIDKSYSVERAEAYVRKNYGPIFRGLGEILGLEKLVRQALTPEAVQDLRALLARLPANATKLYPGLSLREAADRASKDGRKLLAPLTRRNYMVHLSAMCAFAVGIGKLDANPVVGLKGSRRNSVKRRGFRGKQLAMVFGGLEAERGSERWWVIAILTFSGARAGEIIQLGVEDVKALDGCDYFDLTRFDAGGVAVAEKNLKTELSERSVPIHPELIGGGFMTFVAKARAEGRDRLFPSFRQHAAGDWSRDLSKFFAGLCDRVGLPERAFTMHGFRHGFRDAGRDADIDGGVIDALGGWAPASVGQRYGNRFAVGPNSRHMAKIRFDGFTLAPVPAVAEAA